MIRKLLLSASLFAAAWPGVASAAWQEADSKHFVVLSNDDSQHLQKYAEQLERFDKAMRLLRGVGDPPVSTINRVTVYIVRDANEIESLSSYGVRGFYRADISGPVAFVPREGPSKSSVSGSRLFTGTTGGAFDLDSDSVLRHEYSHHFMFDNFPSMALPFWFVEGFAEFHATAIFNNDGSVTFGAPPTYRASALLEREHLTVRELLMSDPRRMDGADIDEVYGRGWLLIHYMTFAPGRRGQLSSFLKELNQGKTPIEAAKVFGDLDALQHEMIKWLRAPKITVETVPAAAIKIDPVTVRALTEGEAAAMPARIRTKAGVDRKSAGTILAMARKLAEKYPDDVNVQLELAEAGLDAQDNAIARAAADRIIALSPNTEKGYIFKGRAEMAIARAAKVTDATAWAQIRHWFVKANRLDNLDPEALYLFYRSYPAAGQAPTANAKAGLYQALELLPDESSVRMTAVLQYVADGDYANASTALAPIAYGASHAKRSGGLLADLVDALATGDKAKIDAAAAAIKGDRDKQEGQS